MIRIDNVSASKKLSIVKSRMVVMVSERVVLGCLMSQMRNCIVKNIGAGRGKRSLILPSPPATHLLAIVVLRELPIALVLL